MFTKMTLWPCRLLVKPLDLHHFAYSEFHPLASLLSTLECWWIMTWDEPSFLAFLEQNFYLQAVVLFFKHGGFDILKRSLQGVRVIVGLFALGVFQAAYGVTKSASLLPLVSGRIFRHICHLHIRFMGGGSFSVPFTTFGRSICN